MSDHGQRCQRFTRSSSDALWFDEVSAMQRFAIYAYASLAALALYGCLLNWNQFRPRDAAMLDATAQSDIVQDETDAEADTGLSEQSDVLVDAETPVDSTIAMDAGVDAVDAVADALPDALADSRTDATVVDADPGCTGPVVVNEVVHTRTSGTDEFIELRNNGTCTVDLSGWRVQYMSAGGTSSASSPSVTFMPGDVIGPGREVIVASTVSPLAPMALRTFTAGIAQAGGGIALFNRSGVRVDSVAYGTLTAAGGHPYAEPVGLMGAPTYSNPSQSIARFPNGQDTDNNAADFHIASMATPGEPNL
jgi:hypothetical protein